MPSKKTYKARYLRAVTVVCLAAKIYFSGVGWAHAGMFALTSTLVLSSAALLLAEYHNFSTVKLWPQTVIAVLYAMATGVFLHAGLRVGGWATLMAAVELSWLVPMASYVFLTAVFEEIVFRKYLLEALISRLPLLAAIAVSALIFFACHLTLIPTPLLTGFLFGYWARKYHSIALAVIVHFMYDLTVYVGKQLEGAKTVLPSGVTLNTAFVAAAVGALLLIIAMVLLQQIYHLARPWISNFIRT